MRQYAQRLNEHYLRAKRMPSYAEMLSLFGLKSKNAVYKRIAQLLRSGLIEKDRKGKLLPIHVQQPARLLGLIRAGFPSPAEEETVDLMSLDEYLISNPQATYLLKVDGDSMIDAGIMPGDLVLVQKGLTPRNGDVVVACVDHEWTLKFFEKHGSGVRLRAANKKYPVIQPRQELIIAGVVIGAIRKYK